MLRRRCIALFAFFPLAAQIPDGAKYSPLKTIDRAKGRLMDDHGLAEQDAWRFLQQQAMANRVKIDEIARRVVDRELSP